MSITLKERKKNEREGTIKGQKCGRKGKRKMRMKEKKGKGGKKEKRKKRKRGDGKKAKREKGRKKGKGLLVHVYKRKNK